MPSTLPKLFQPLKVGRVTLQHRVALAPLTRVRADANHVPLHPVVKEYYQQRASAPGTLLVTEATVIAPKAGGYPHVPGIWNDEQVSAWRQVTDAVHAKGSFIFLQLWALGRQAKPAVLAASGLPYVSASDIPTTEMDEAPRPLTKEEIKEYVDLFGQAAKNAVLRAGFDGVEVHGANGYLVDQFLEDVSNRRTDEYGGSIENRSRFGLEVLQSIVDAVGQDRSAIRLSPWNKFQGMGMADPKPTFSYFISRIAELFPNLAYLHVTNDYDFMSDVYDPSFVTAEKNNDFIRDIWAPRPLVTNGGLDRQAAIETAEKGDIVAFGRHFISNPDLPLRLKKNIPLAPYDRSTFYGGPESGKGYTDYPFADETSSTEEA